MRIRLVALTTGTIAGIVGCTSEDQGQCAIVSSIGLVGDSGVGSVMATSPSATELDIDFGDIAFGQSAAATVQIQNSGPGALALSIVGPSSDPELFSVAAVSKAIAADSSGELHIDFQSYKIGPVSSTYTIDFEEPASCPSDAGLNHPPVTLNLTGTGVATCLTTTPNVVDFGTTPIGTTVTKSVTLTSCAGTIDGIIVEILGADASLFKVASPPTSLGPFSSVQVEISYSPNALEDRSLASLMFVGSAGDKSSLNLFGEPTDKDDGGVACLPGGDYCCVDDATIVAVGQSDQHSCRTCVIDGGVAIWSVSPVGTPCAETSYGDAGNAGVCVPSGSSDSAVCSCSVSFEEDVAFCGRGATTVDVDAGVLPCCFGQCILDAGATVGVCPCFPNEDGGLCP